MRSPSIVTAFSLATLALALPTGAEAAAFLCLSSSEAFKDALEIAGSNGEHDVIQLRVGTYVTGPLPFAYFAQEDFDLTVVGGYDVVQGVGCVPTRPAHETVITGSGVRRALTLSGLDSSTGDITLKNVSIRNGFTSGSGGGLQIGGAIDGDVTIERVEFLFNRAELFGGAVSGGTTGGHVRIVNSLFRENRAGVDFGAASLAAAAGEFSQFYNNTVVLNGCTEDAPDTCDGGVRIAGGDWRLANSLFWGNLRVDWYAVAPFDLFTSSVPQMDGLPPASGTPWSIHDPHFVGGAALNDFRLTETSPLRDAGSYFAVLDPDLDNRPRYVNTVLDVGAYEVQALLRDGFETPQF